MYEGPTRCLARSSLCLQSRRGARSFSRLHSVLCWAFPGEDALAEASAAGGAPKASDTPDFHPKKPTPQESPEARIERDK